MGLSAELIEPRWARLRWRRGFARYRFRTPVFGWCVEVTHGEQSPQLPLTASLTQARVLQVQAPGRDFVALLTQQTVELLAL